jgi:RNA polymerase sigma-70 factor (ECF subfamily)
VAIFPVHNEKLILEQVAAGDEQAFARLFEAYHNQLGEYVFRLTDSLPVTEEIVQDVFLKIWLKRTLLPGLDSFTNYLFILLRNHTLNSLRKRATERVRYLQWATVFEEDEAPDEVSEQYRAWIDEAVDQLPERQKEIYLLSRYQHLTHQQIATQLNIAPSTVKTHLERAVAAIKLQVQDKVPAVILLLFLLR